MATAKRPQAVVLLAGCALSACTATVPVGLPEIPAGTASIILVAVSDTQETEERVVLAVNYTEGKKPSFEFSGFHNSDYDLWFLFYACPLENIGLTEGAIQLAGREDERQRPFPDAPFQIAHATTTEGESTAWQSAEFSQLPELRLSVSPDLCPTYAFRTIRLPNTVGTATTGLAVPLDNQTLLVSPVGPVEGQINRFFEISWDALEDPNQPLVEVTPDYGVEQPPELPFVASFRDDQGTLWLFEAGDGRRGGQLWKGDLPGTLERVGDPTRTYRAQVQRGALDGARGAAEFELFLATDTTFERFGPVSGVPEPRWSRRVQTFYYLNTFEYADVLWLSPGQAIGAVWGAHLWRDGMVSSPLFDSVFAVEQLPDVGLVLGTRIQAGSQQADFKLYTFDLQTKTLERFLDYSSIHSTAGLVPLEDGFAWADQFSIFVRDRRMDETCSLPSFGLRGLIWRMLSLGDDVVLFSKNTWSAGLTPPTELEVTYVRQVTPAKFCGDP